MIKRIHGTDRHKRYSTICVYNLEGEEINFISHQLDLKVYIKGLDKQDAVILEAGNGTFHYADLIEKQGAKVYILNPRKFKIIKDSWQKTDKYDARNMAEALWTATINKRLRLPLVYKPDYKIRELRRIFTQYQFVNKHIVSIKNMIQACLSDVGIVLEDKHKKKLFTPETGYIFFNYIDVDKATRVAVKSNLDILYVLLGQKENLFKQIIKFGEFLKDKVKLLMEIKGVSPLLALVFLSEIGGDVSRFKKTKKMNSYLGVVPGIKQSGNIKRTGKIIKASRHLARTLFTQSVIHLVKASENMIHFYKSLRKRKSAGKSRIAVIRKVFGIMRSMLLNKEHFWHIDEKCYSTKIRNYERELSRLKKSA